MSGKLCRLVNLKVDLEKSFLLKMNFKSIWSKSRTAVSTSFNRRKIASDSGPNFTSRISDSYMQTRRDFLMS